eukprot:SAG11_NODE_585_length_8349_cov_38.121939_12_plen_65_part_00
MFIYQMVLQNHFRVEEIAAVQDSIQTVMMTAESSDNELTWADIATVDHFYEWTEQVHSRPGPTG